MSLLKPTASLEVWFLLCFEPEAYLLAYCFWAFLLAALLLRASLGLYLPNDGLLDLLWSVILLLIALDAVGRQSLSIIFEF